MASHDGVPVARVASWLEKLIPRFMQNRREDVGVIREALARGDFQRIKSLGHNLKGIGPSYGFEPLCAIGLELERAAAAADQAAIAAATDALASYVERVKIEYV